MPFLKIKAQELSAEFKDSKGNVVTKCNCKELGKEDYLSVKVDLKSNVFKYDKVVFYFGDANGSAIGSVEVGGDKMRAEWLDKGYAIVKIEGIGSTNDGGYCARKKPYNLGVMVKGFMITGYKEELDGNIIRKSPVFGESTDFGTSNSIPVQVNKAAFKRNMIVTGIILGVLAVYLAIHFVPSK